MYPSRNLAGPSRPRAWPCSRRPLPKDGHPRVAVPATTRTAASNRAPEPRCRRFRSPWIRTQLFSRRVNSANIGHRRHTPAHRLARDLHAVARKILSWRCNGEWSANFDTITCAGPLAPAVLFSIGCAGFRCLHRAIAGVLRRYPGSPSDGGDELMALTGLLAEQVQILAAAMAVLFRLSQIVHHPLANQVPPATCVRYASCSVLARVPRLVRRADRLRVRLRVLTRTPTDDRLPTRSRTGPTCPW